MEKKLRKRITIIAIVIVVQCVGVFGTKNIAHATEEPQYQVEIEVSANIAEESMEKYLEGFQEKYPGITVIYNNYSNYEQDIKSRVEEGDYGDVLFAPDFINSTEYDKYFEPLGSYETLAKKYNYMEGCKMKDNVIYGIPSSAYLMGIIYNKAVFDKAGVTEPPKSIEEFIQALHSVKERTDAIPFYTNYADTWPLQTWEQFTYLEMTGDANYKENGFVYEMNPFSEGTTHYNVYRMLYDIVNEGLSEENPQETVWDDSKKMLNEGKIGCMAIGSWALYQVKAAGNNGEDVAFMPFPNEIDGKQYMTIATDYCYAINKNSSQEEKEAARLYIDYMLDESGYTLEHYNLSIVKTDPFPDSYENMDNVVCLSNNSATSGNYEKKIKLSANLNLWDNYDEVKRVIEAAAGMRTEGFDDIVEDWNTRWEASRTEDMMPDEEDSAFLTGTVIADNYEVSFSDTEKEYLNEIQVLRIGYVKNMAPFQYEVEGEFMGVAAAILENIAANTKIEMAYYGYRNTTEMINALTNGEIDIAAGIEKNADYEDTIKYSKEYMECMSVIIKSDTIQTSQIEEAKAVIVNGEVSSYIKKNADTLTVASLEEGIEAVEALKADYIVSNYYSADYYIRRLECEHVTVLPLTQASNICFGFGKGVDTRLISVTNKCIYSIPSGNIQIMLMEHMDSAAQEITFRRYVEANPIPFIVALVIIFSLIVIVIIIMMREREKSARKHALDMKRYEMLSALVDEYVFEYDISKNIIHFDKKFETQFDFSGDVDLNTYAQDNRQMNLILRQLDTIRQKGENTLPIFRMETEKGGKQWYKLVAYVVKDSKNVATHMVGKLVNAQEEMQEMQQIQDKAQRDPLTGLYNRDGFKQNFEKLYEHSMMPITFAIMDIDNFKTVNDTLGHAGGDEALKLLAQSLNEIFADKAVIARYGGDEFILCIYKEQPESIERLLGSLIKKMDRQYQYGNATAKLSISLGAIFTEEKIIYEELFRKADKELYQVKENGKNAYQMNKI